MVVESSHVAMKSDKSADWVVKLSSTILLIEPNDPLLYLKLPDPGSEIRLLDKNLYLNPPLSP